jgi:hypothetical protein
MTLNHQGYAILDLPPLDDSIKASFGDLGLDLYVPVKNRFRRFAQYRLVYQDSDWNFERLPHRAYVAYSKFNSVAGGIKREYKAIVADFTDIIRLATAALPLDANEDWQINVHQTRIFVKKGELQGVIVPEGPHKDGHEFVFIGVYDRHNVTGAEMTLRPDHDKETPFLTRTLQTGQGVVLDDRNLWHYVNDIEAIDDREIAFRDTLIISYSRWSEKWYGDEFEREALADGPDAKKCMPQQ